MLDLDYFLHLCVPCTAAWHQQHGEHWDWLEESDKWPDKTSLGHWVTKLHYHNYQTWHYEDYCRGIDNSKIVWAKRGIDKNNQLRCDAIEMIDDLLISQYQHPGSTAPVNSETIGSIFDRISVNNLKIYHTDELYREGQTKLGDRLVVLHAQAKLLRDCAIALFDDMLADRRRCVQFKQLKMYNSSDTNKHYVSAD